jgi:demethylsterigmatocystin 6-O-methyltransferase
VTGAKIYYLRLILHDYPDEKCIAILKNTAAAMDEDSLIFVDEIILPNSKAYYEAVELDMFMMVSLAGAERTEKQWRTLVDTAGLRIKEIFTYNKDAGDSVISIVRK